MSLIYQTYSVFFKGLFIISVALFCVYANAQNKTLSDINNSDDQQEGVRIIEPQKDIAVAKSAAIDDERFELGFFTGMLAVEDFNSNLVWGVSFSYHVSPVVILQINHGTSEVESAAFEEDLDSNFLGSDRDFTYTELLAGYRVLRGRSFLGSNKKYNSDIYLLLGGGSVDFAGESNTSFTLGASYRVVLTDSLVGTLDFRSHSVDRTFLDESKSTLNNELAFGLNFLF